MAVSKMPEMATLIATLLRMLASPSQRISHTPFNFPFWYIGKVLREKKMSLNDLPNGDEGVEFTVTSALLPPLTCFLCVVLARRSVS
jgi:hypothetical protein